MNTKNIIWSVVGGIVGALLLMAIVHVTTSPKSFGSLANCSNGYTCYTYLDILNGIVIDGTQQIGANGTVLSNVVSAGCSMQANNSITASTSGYAYCTGVTGVTSLDGVAASFSTSTAAFSMVADNFWIVDAKASTTAGAIDFMVYNGTGKTAVPSAVGRMGSSTVIQAAH